jgi:hypothetical protein
VRVLLPTRLPGLAGRGLRDHDTHRCGDGARRGDSKLLLFEFVLTPGDVPLYHTRGCWISAVALLSGMERSEEQWEALLGRAGLEVAGFWGTVPDGKWLIEAVWTGEVGVLGVYFW